MFGGLFFKVEAKKNKMPKNLKGIAGAGLGGGTHRARRRRRACPCRRCPRTRRALLGERRGEEEGQRAVLSELIHFQMGPWVAVEPRDRGFFLGVF